MNNSRLLKQAANLKVSSNGIINKKTGRAPSKGILKKSTVFTTIDSVDIDSIDNASGFSNELRKVKKKIGQSKSISFQDQ